MGLTVSLEDKPAFSILIALHPKVFFATAYVPRQGPISKAVRLVSISDINNAAGILPPNPKNTEVSLDIEMKDELFRPNALKQQLKIV